MIALLIIEIITLALVALYLIQCLYQLWQEANRVTYVRLGELSEHKNTTRAGVYERRA